MLFWDQFDPCFLLSLSVLQLTLMDCVISKVIHCIISSAHILPIITFLRAFIFCSPPPPSSLRFSPPVRVYVWRWVRVISTFVCGRAIPPGIYSHLLTHFGLTAENVANIAKALSRQMQICRGLSGNVENWDNFVVVMTGFLMDLQGALLHQRK